MASLNNRLESDGYFIIKNLVNQELIAQLVSEITNKISMLADELGVSTAEYLNSTGRWGSASEVTKNISLTLDAKIQSYFEEKSLQCAIVKSNVLCKNADIVDAIPFHQDISYSWKDPYHFSVWLALNDVTETSAPLKVVQGSHKWEIQPLVDFWYPYFSDEYSLNPEKYKIKSLPISAGNAIVFGSRLWHGSDRNTDGRDRFAYATRWIIKDKTFPFIPKPEPSVFGILNCGKITESILRKYLSLLNKDECVQANSMEELIKSWIAYLTDTTFNIPEVNTTQAKRDLNRLLILNRASGPTSHDGGDIAGKVYKNLWLSLLVFLNKRVNVVELE